MNIQHLTNCYNYFLKKLKINICPFCISYLISILLYLPNITTVLPNPDAIWNSIVYKDEYGWETICGRPMLGILASMTGFTISPTIFSLVGLCFCVISGLIIAELFNITKLLSKVLCSLLIVLSISVQGTILGYYYFPYYMFAMLLSVIALSIAIHVNDITSKIMKISMILVASATLCISLAIYQAYIGLVIPLGIFIIIREVLYKAPKKVINLNIYMGLILFLGIISYNIISLIALNGSEGRFSSFTFDNFISNIAKCYLYCYSYYLGNGFLNNNYQIFLSRRDINLIFFIVLFVTSLFVIKRNKFSFSKIIVSFCYLSIIPISLFITSLASNHSLIFGTSGAILLTGFTLIYIVLIAIIEHTHFKIFHFASNISLIMVIIMLTCLLVDSQTFMKYRLNKMDEVARLIVAETSKYIYDGEAEYIMIVGNMENGNFPDQYSSLQDSIKWTMASYGTVWSDPTGSNSCWNMYIKDFLGTSLPICYNKELDNIDYSDMPCFPANGSIKIINNTVLVKLSD